MAEEEVVYCNCTDSEGNHAPARFGTCQNNKNGNQGETYWACNKPNGDKGCGFFRWTNDDLNEKYEQKKKHSKKAPPKKETTKKARQESQPYPVKQSTPPATTTAKPSDTDRAFALSLIKEILDRDHKRDDELLAVVKDIREILVTHFNNPKD